VNGEPGAPESPLITASSYGDAEVARVLVEAGADLEATAGANAGGVPGGTALLHAAVFGMTAVVDVLVAAGVRVPDLVLAAAAGDVRGRLRPDTAEQERILALIMAADHQRLPVIDALIGAGTPVDGVDTTWGRHPLRTAATNGRPASVRRLLAHGADPALCGAEGRTPLDLCRSERSRYVDTRGHDEVEVLLTGSNKVS
jgi:ankyrin repeat protein